MMTEAAARRCLASRIRGSYRLASVPEEFSSLAMSNRANSDNMEFCTGLEKHICMSLLFLVEARKHIWGYLT